MGAIIAFGAGVAVGVAFAPWIKIGWAKLVARLRKDG